VQALKTAGDDLTSLADQAQTIYAGDPVYVGEMESMWLRLGRAYSTIVPAQQLISDLRPDASLTRQFSDFVDTVAKQLQSKMPSEISALYESPSYDRFVGAGAALDELLSDYEGYRQYRAGYQSSLDQWRQRFAFVGSEIAIGIEELQRLEGQRRNLAEEEIRGDEAGRTEAPSPVREETMGIVSGDQEEETFLVDIPAGFTRVELAVFEGEPTATRTSGWTAAPASGSTSPPSSRRVKRTPSPTRIVLAAPTSASGYGSLLRSRWNGPSTWDPMRRRSCLQKSLGR